jgi:hypothetical protein
MKKFITDGEPVTNQRNQPALHRVPGDVLRLSKLAVALCEADESHTSRPERVGDHADDTIEKLF